MDLYLILGGMWGVLLSSVLLLSCFASMRLNIMRARYVMLAYTLLIIFGFLCYAYLTPDRLNDPDIAIYQEYAYLLPFVIVPIIISIGCWHIANRILPLSMRKKSMLIFLTAWFSSPIILFIYLKTQSSPEAMMGLMGVLVFVALFSLLAFIVNMVWLIRVVRKR